MSNITELLESLADFTEAKATTETLKESQRQLILASVKPQLDELDMAFATTLGKLAEDIAKLEIEIKQTVLSMQSSQKGSRLQAVWSKGRETWDSKRLDGYALAHPEILSLRNIGEPSVSIRQVKPKE